MGIAVHCHDTYGQALANINAAGAVDPKQAAYVAWQLLDMGCYEISLGDTIGVGTPGSMNACLDECIKAGVPLDVIAVHCHDTQQWAASVDARTQRARPATWPRRMSCTCCMGW